MHGFTENYIRIAAKYDPVLINELRTVRLSAINDNGLVEIEEALPEVLTH
jgi:threonylcarbamoyladenosine tRNA methylthiotransferase MtaB